MLLLLAVGKILHAKGLVKLWIMSATLDVDAQEGTTVIDLGGFAFPVRVVPVLLEDPEQFQTVAADLAARTACKGACTLVFVPGQDDTKEVARAVRSFHEVVGDYAVNGHCDVLTNHGKSTEAESQMLLERVPPDVWKAVVATERVAKSVTAPDASDVVDTALANRTVAI